MHQRSWTLLPTIPEGYEATAWAMGKRVRMPPTMFGFGFVGWANEPGERSLLLRVPRRVERYLQPADLHLRWRAHHAAAFTGVLLAPLRLGRWSLIIRAAVLKGKRRRTK